MRWRLRIAAAAAAAMLAVGMLGCGSGGQGAEPEGAQTVDIGPGDDAAAVVRGAAAGSRFRFTDGTHRGVSLQPREDDIFTATDGAVLSGAVEVSGFTGSSGRWSAPSPVTPSPPSGQCRQTTPACAYPEELFLDSVPLVRVLDPATVTAGHWAMEQTGSANGANIVMANDPSGRIVELSTTQVAFFGTAKNVTIDGVHLEHYASPAQVGVIHMNDGSAGWLVENCVVRDSHAVGVVVIEGSTLRNCWVEGNGQQGIGAKGNAVLIEDNVLARNNRAGFDPGWSAGGAKFAFADGLVVRRNVAIANDGAGLWTDIDCIRVTYEDNWVQDNTGAGIFHEISYQAAIRGNRVIGNGSDAPWVWGAGIQIAGSTDVTVENNVVEGNRNGITGIDQERGSGAFGEYRLRNLVVTGNTVRNSGQTGVAQDHDDPGVYERGHRFDGNTYQGRVSWGWKDAERTWDEWRAFGFDAHGSFTP